MSDYKFISNMVAPDEINRAAEGRAITAKWAKTGLLRKLQDKKAQVMARLLETEAKELKKLNEASTVSDIAGFNKIAFPLVRRVFAQLIANEIVAVQPMSLPSGLLFYLDFKYDRNKSGFTTGGSLYGNRDSVYNQGLQGIGAQNAAGGFFQLNSGFSTRSYLLAPAGSAVSVGTTLTSALFNATVTGWNFTLSSSAAADIMQLQNIRLARSGEVTLASSTFRGQTAVESLTADSLYQYMDPNLTTFNSNGTVTLYFAAGAISSTGFAGNVPASGGVMATVLYGPMRADVQDNPGPVGGTYKTALGDFEAVTGIPQINIAISSVPVMAQTRKLKTSWTPELAQDLNAYHALDAEVELTTILSETIALEIDREILGELLHGASVRAAWSRKLGRYVSLSADGITITTNTFASASQGSYQAFYGTQQDWYQTLGEVVTSVSNEIHKRSLRHGANFIVCSPEISSIIESINGFKPSILSDASEVEYSFGMEKSGTLSNRYTVYKDPYFPESYMLLGYKGGSFLETGFVYAPYVPLLVTPTIFAPEDFTPRRGVMTRYAKQMVRPEMYGTIFVTDLDWIASPASV